MLMGKYEVLVKFSPTFPFVFRVARIQLLEDDLPVTHGVANFHSGSPLILSAAKRRYYPVFPCAFLTQRKFVLEFALRGFIILMSMMTRCLGMCPRHIRFAIRGRARAQNIDSIIQLRQLLQVQRLEGTTSNESAAKNLFVYRFSFSAHLQPTLRIELAPLDLHNILESRLQSLHVFIVSLAKRAQTAVIFSL